MTEGNTIFDEGEPDHCIFCGKVTLNCDCCEDCWEMGVESQEGFFG
jgi:hypothetical protein